MRTSLLVVICAVAALAACGDNVEPPLVDGSSVEDCGIAGDEDGNGMADCDDPVCAAATSCQPACGNGKREAAEGCDDGNAIDGDSCDSNCTATGCGNGIMTAGEVCDDGNATDGDDCDVNCTFTGCGNGIMTAGEGCDDGNATEGDNCDSNCTPTGCGNGIMTAGEGCDDGNATEGDNCDSNCTPTGCGNGIMTAGEGCDDGNATDGDNCDSNCTPTGCGNGIMTTGEFCDDGNVTDGDTCDSNCTPTGCGNGIVTTGELCDDGNVTNGDNCDNNCTPTGCGNGIVTTGEVCDDGNTANWDSCPNTCADVSTYIKASNTAGQDFFGFSMALSADGSTLAVAAREEDSAAIGIDGNQTSNMALDSGAVYVFVRSDGTWVQQAYLKAFNTGAGDQFGNSIALSADGSTLAVGATSEDSAATGIDGNGSDNSAPTAGAVYVFTRGGTTWSQQAYVKASNTATGDMFGVNVALSADGSTLAVGARDEDSAATGIDGNQADNSASASGAVYVFSRSGTTWNQRAYIKASNTGANDTFGAGIALSGDGSTLAVGASGEDSAATGIGGNQADETSGSAGAVYVFVNSGGPWSQQAYIKASNTGVSNLFGGANGLALSNDGSTLAVGATGESSAAAGVDGNQANNGIPASGAVYMFERAGTMWSQQAYVKASNTGMADSFGSSIALTRDGLTLAVAAEREDSAAIGIGGNQADNSVTDAGAVYVFTRGATWSQRAYVKASNTGNGAIPGDSFGRRVALSDAGTLAVSAVFEDSNATGIGGDQSNNMFANAGAAYVIR